MILILEVALPLPTHLDVIRQTFDEQGGSIGRDETNAWVLPHVKVSAHHAHITHRNGVFYIEDTSRNGVCLNSLTNRLVRGRPSAVKHGDRILIDPYDIRVSIVRDQNDEAARHARGWPDVPASNSPFGAFNAFDLDDPSAPQAGSPSLLDEPDESNSDRELDPIVLLNLAPAETPVRKKPRAADLGSGSRLDNHFQPPDIEPAPVAAPRADAISIPIDYDPLPPVHPTSIALPSSRVPPRREPREVQPKVEHAQPPPTPAARPTSTPKVSSSRSGISKSVSPPDVAGISNRLAPSDLAAVLEGAGLDPANATPELARTIGEILKVVVSGVMEVMRSRRDIKEEFRLSVTRFRLAENNPLKFSANVDDALHNLFVKRNAAYLAPVDAFEDAFSDLRNHQVAMLAGMRAAFEFILAEFDADRLQHEFDRQLSKSLVPAKFRYWDLYRERQQELVKDREASFRKLFGEEFARAYQEQLKQFSASSKTPPQADT